MGRKVKGNGTRHTVANSERIRVAFEAAALDHLGLSDETRTLLQRYHQRILREGLTWAQVREEVGYDSSVLGRAFRGRYDGSYDNIARAIKQFYELDRSREKDAVFVCNTIARQVWSVCEYALTNNVIGLIVGESRSGKTEAARAWIETDIAAGRATMIETPPIGGAGSMMRALCKACGVGQKHKVEDKWDLLCRAFGPGRILLIDEAHRLLPSSGGKMGARRLEILRGLHDATKCGLVIIATARFERELLDSDYMYEQLLGRIEAPLQIAQRIPDKDWLPIVRQWFEPSAVALDEMRKIVDSRGRIASLVHTLRLAARLARKAGEDVGDSHFLRVLKLRRQMFHSEFFDRGAKPVKRRKG